MSTEEEFLRWLGRSQTSFVENLQFALKAWNSAEFTLSSKYELILSWLCSEAVKVPVLPYKELMELLQLRAQPGLISQCIKENFVEMLLKLAKRTKCNESNSCIWPKLLYRLCNFEAFQDLYRTKYDLHAQVCSTLLECYELYLDQCDPKKQNGNTTEADFFICVVSNLQDHIKRTGDAIKLNKNYIDFIVQPLVRVILLMKTHTLCFFDELLHLERLLTDHLSDKELVDRVLQLPLYVRLLILECAIVNRRGVERFLQHLLMLVFKELPNEVQEKNSEEIKFLLTAAAYTMETFRKHDINLNFKMNIESEPTALTFLGEQLLKCIQLCKKNNLREVLMLLCATLRLNPLILEQDIFQITTWMIVAEKSCKEEFDLFGKYLVSLMDMFRRLSRAEKLVFNMLKSLKEWLDKFEIISVGKARKSLKRKADNTCISDEISYLNIIFKEFYNSKQCSREDIPYETAFPYLRSTWPSESVGVAFSELITGLVSKPALVIWKSLLYSLKELLEKLKLHPETLGQEKNQFLLELHSALLCQYFTGCRLIEQYDKFSNEINEQLHITKETLSQFGYLVLSQEHNNRPVNALLEVAFHAANFELLLNYYLPDGFKSDDLPQTEHVHTFLNNKDWKTIQQRLLSNGKSQSKYLFNRIMLQRTQARTLLQSTKGQRSKIDLKDIINSTADNEVASDVTMLIRKVPSTKWFVSRMEQNERKNLINHLFDVPTAIAGIEDDLKSLEILAIGLCVRMSQSFIACGKDSILAALKCDYDTLSEYMQTDQNTADKKLTKYIVILEAHIKNDCSMKEESSNEKIQNIVRICRQLPLGYLHRQMKNLVFTFLLAFYIDLKTMKTEELNNNAAEVFEIIIDVLHFGQHVTVFKYFSLSTILKIFPVASCWKFYEFVFGTIKTEEKGSEQFLKCLTENLTLAQNTDSKFGDDQRRLLLIAIETLASLSGPSVKRARKYFESLLTIYSKYINSYFSKLSERQELDVAIETNTKKEKKFVEKTLAGFAPYANALLINASKAGADSDDKPSIAVDENFRRICKIYIGHSMDYRNPYAIRLLQVALNHRQLLHLDQDEIEFVLSHYWQQLNADLNKEIVIDANTIKTTETAVKMIIGNKTNEDLLLTLQTLATNMHELKDFRNILRCLELIAKCSFSTIKGAIFNEKFKSIMCNIIMHLVKDEQQQFVDKEQILAILAAAHSLVENKMIPISADTLDDILAILMDINIKRFPITEDNLHVFKKLHLSISDLLSCLIRQRHILLMDRVPQFMHIFKDLIQSIVWYKSDRQKDIALTENELEDLAELAMKLEALMHLIAAHSVHVKRVAPFVLTFVISLMVANKRTTTLYPKIKTHVDNVCYDLVGICDHRVGRFILRCSNEAARQVYELYVKDHKKYHKFKGKV